jgi:hypothetical protein
MVRGPKSKTGVELKMPPDTTICAGAEVNFVIVSNGTNYSWEPTAGLSNPNVQNPVASPLTTTTYSVAASINTPTTECPVTGSVTVTVLQAKVFAGDDTAVAIGQPLPLHALDPGNYGFTQYQWSPASGLNNPSSPDPTAAITRNITHYFNVYNRWGQQIFSTANPAIGWDGWRGPGAVGVGFSRKFGICLSSLRHPYKALVIFRKSSYW